MFWKSWKCRGFIGIVKGYKCMKICYITTISLTIRAFFIPQLEYLSEHGYDVTVICSYDKNLQNDLGDNIKYIPIHIDRGVSPKTIIKSIKNLIKVFKKENFDLIQYSTPNAAFCAAIAAILTRVPIRNYHLMGLRYLGAEGIARFILKKIETITCKLSTHIECVTKSNLEYAIAEGIFQRKKAVVVGNGSSGGVDLIRFDVGKRIKWNKELRRELKIDEHDFVFGFVGRITRDKGINEILEAFYRLNGHCKLLLIGTQEGVHTLDKNLWAKAAKDKDIIFHKNVSDIEKYYATMDVLLLPSYREGFGMVIAEAAAMGTPAIVSNIPGPVDVIRDGITAYTVSARDSDSLRKTMQMFLDNPNKSKQMCADCVDFIKNTFDNNILFEKILERKNALMLDI